MISFLVGVLVAVVPALGGKSSSLPWGGLLFTVIAASCFTNFYGDDGSALWLTLVVPGAERPDLRGRQWAWFLVVGPAGLLLTVVLTAVSGQGWAWPWVLGTEPALVLGSVGLLAWISVTSVQGPAPDGGPTPMRVLKAHLALIAVPLLALFPALALLITGQAAHAAPLKWLAIPAGLAWAVLLCWRTSRAARLRLLSRGPEIFALARGAGL